MHVIQELPLHVAQPHVRLQRLLRAHRRPHIQQRYEILQDGLTESMNAFIIEQMAQGYSTENKNPIHHKDIGKESNMERLLCQLRLSSGNQ